MQVSQGNLYFDEVRFRHSWNSKVFKSNVQVFLSINEVFYKMEFSANVYADPEFLRCSESVLQIKT